MTRRKKIILWAIVIVALVGGFLALCLSSWNQTYGLPEEVIAEEKMPTAEETIRLYFYDKNRGSKTKMYQLLTNEYRHTCEGHDKSNAALGCEESEIFTPIIQDIRLLSVEDRTLEPSENRRDFNVVYNEGTLWASAKRNENTVDIDFDLVRMGADKPWRINSIGNG